MGKIKISKDITLWDLLLIIILAFICFMLYNIWITHKVTEQHLFKIDTRLLWIEEILNTPIEIEFID